MYRPTIQNTEALFQAGTTIGTYLLQAIVEIDRRLGTGYAEAHPELLGACVNAQALDYNSTALTAALYEVSDSIKETSPST